jgi:hypothetical protein
MARKNGVALETEEAAAALAGQVLLMTLPVKFFFFKKASGSPACWAVRASSDNKAGDDRTSGGARRSAPNILTCLAFRKQKGFTNTPPRHRRMRECVKESKFRAS